MAYYLGIDTSNYTTSVAVVDSNGEIVFDERIVLDVEQGKRGLRQSDALFLHIKNLPILFERISCEENLAAVGVSVSPRRTEGSYMPVFLAGVNCATAVSATHNIPLFSFSHQEGHLRAGEVGLAQDLPEKFYAVHLSGGTTEILNVRREGARFSSDIIGATQDVSAGQLVDRTGVKLGLGFPCGKELDRMANEAEDFIPFKLSTKETNLSFSGVEAQVMRAIQQGTDARIIAKSVLIAISDSLARTFHAAFKLHGEKPLLLVGGVASNTLIRERLGSEFGNSLVFSKPQYATDNAVGIAYLAKECAI
ncbi:MAG: hypothetical protein IJA08_00845 [Clostridia bacterium]|nr:hypothetical protein [Clostridia bacterium]